MSHPKISLSSPHMGGDEQKFIQEAFDSNWIAPSGPGISSFENDLENYLGNVNVVALNSGTAAIHLGLLLLGVKKDDEVNIGIREKHRISAGKEGIEFLEISFGDFDEEDIVRYEDKYGRI